MPTYDYSCDACEHEFEVFEPISAEPQKKCPKCKKNKLRRLFGAGAGLVFKGSGFYQTDYRSESYKKAATADKPAESSSITADVSPTLEKGTVKVNKPAKGESSGPAKKSKSGD